MYDWRRLTPDERNQALQSRMLKGHPWHAPPHQDRGECAYHVSSSCYEHQPVLGLSPQRMAEYESHLLQSVAQASDELYAWSVLPNHYHLLLRTRNIHALLKVLGQLHGRTSHQWNGEENTRGRKVWHSAADRAMRSGRHFWATMNYVHHNPVHHRYCQRWQEWPYSSARLFLEEVGRKEAIRIWEDYPIRDYGKGWDDPDL